MSAQYLDNGGQLGSRPLLNNDVGPKGILSRPDTNVQSSRHLSKHRVLAVKREPDPHGLTGHLLLSACRRHCGTGRQASISALSSMRVAVRRLGIRPDFIVI